MRSMAATTSSASSPVAKEVPDAHRCWVSRQTPMRSSPPDASMTAASSSKVRPMVAPAPAVFSSRMGQGPRPAVGGGAPSRATQEGLDDGREGTLEAGPAVASDVEDESIGGHAVRHLEIGGQAAAGSRRHPWVRRGHVDEIGGMTEGRVAPWGARPVRSGRRSRSSRLYCEGFHMRGLWVKTWTTSAPMSAPLERAGNRPVPARTWAPMRMVRHGTSAGTGRCRIGTCP